MKKLTSVLTGLLLSVVLIGSSSAYTFEDKIDFWNLSGSQYGADQVGAHPFDAVLITDSNPLVYTHDINDSVDFDAGDYVTDAWLELDFTNDLTDTHGSMCWGRIKWDKREMAQYGFDGNSWISIGEVDNSAYEMLVDIDWLNDDGFLDVSLNITNPRGTATAWLDHSVLSGNAAPVPEPATLLLLGVGMLGLAGVSRKKNNSQE